ncbi:DUF3168 domain-containing protein [Actinomadura macrotermitis]|uniref:DUF3168 domain-containing protein n=1 Tax=Actinomadura macrotermitis TaxID=2585200 RepID=A0A7K0C2V0_9ACTN|nr:DUF3168 domain-containing protein [Actinomadura macrotermitis]MQY07761.1 hypothetical protein [Actinomadura macrotermitis]
MSAQIFPDVEKLVGDRLRARPELAGVAIGPLPPAGTDGTVPAVVLIRDGGSYREDEVIDDAQLRIETYGPDLPAAHALILKVRALLADLPEADLPGVVVSDVSEEGGVRGLRRLTDRNRPAFTRYVLNVRLLIRFK